MENILHNLFYSEKEKVAFFVAGYTDNSSNVSEIISMLNKGTDIFLSKVPVERSDVRTKFITQSRRYQQMRVFFATVKECPEGAVTISDDNGWTMDKWLEC